MKAKLLCLALVLTGDIVFAGIPETTPGLRAVVAPSHISIRIREPFTLTLRVENPTTTNQTIRVMTCAWQDEWQCNNTNIELGFQACPENFAANVIIPPGGACVNVYQSAIYNLIPDKELSFRMGFTSIGSTNTLWSNEVKIQILPPANGTSNSVKLPLSVKSGAPTNGTPGKKFVYPLPLATIQRIDLELAKLKHGMTGQQVRAILDPAAFEAPGMAGGPTSNFHVIYSLSTNCNLVLFWDYSPQSRSEKFVRYWKVGNGWPKR